MVFLSLVTIDTKLLESLIFVNPQHTDYLDPPQALFDALSPKVPHRIIVTVGSQLWVFQIRPKFQNKCFHLYGKTFQEFVVVKKLKQGSILQFIVGQNHILLTDFNVDGLSTEYYNVDNFGATRPRCMVRTLNLSLMYQKIPVPFWDKLDVSIRGSKRVALATYNKDYEVELWQPKRVSLATYNKDYEVELWYDHTGLLMGFYGDNWTQVYEDIGIQADCFLVLQHYVSDNMSELKVYSANGGLYPFKDIDGSHLFPHKHIHHMFEILPDYDGDYKDIVSYDDDPRYIFVRRLTVEVDSVESSATSVHNHENVEEEASNDQLNPLPVELQGHIDAAPDEVDGAEIQVFQELHPPPHLAEDHPQFTANLQGSVLKKNAVHVPVRFVRQLSLWEYNHADITCGTFHQRLVVRSYADRRSRAIGPKTNVKIVGDWFQLLKQPYFYEGKHLTFELTNAITDPDGIVYFTIT